MMTIHPVVPKPLHTPEPLTHLYKLVHLSRPQGCLLFLLSWASQHFFAFEWEDPHTRRQTQLTWTLLLQGFKNSPTLFGEVLAVTLAAFPRETLNCTLVQYMDDLLLASQTKRDCWKVTKALLALLSTTGYKMLWKKAPICRQTLLSTMGYNYCVGQP